MSMFNTTAIITTIRHGEKDSDGNLTSTGLNQGAKRGSLTKNLDGDVILFHSGSGRVKNTIQALASHINETAIEHMQEELLQNFQLQSYESPYLHYLFDPLKKGDYFAKWDSIEKTNEEIEKRIVTFLTMADQSIESQIFPSPKEMALRVLKVIKTQIDFATITKHSFKTNFINGTHEPVITSFLFYALNNFKYSNPTTFIQKYGVIDFADGFDIEVLQNDYQEIQIYLHFRNNTIELSLSELSSQLDHF